MKNAREATVGERVKYWIESVKKVTQSAAGNQIGVTRSAVSKIVTGGGDPSYKFLVGMAKAWPDCNMNWIIMGNDRPELGNVRRFTMQGEPDEYEIMSHSPELQKLKMELELAKKDAEYYKKIAEERERTIGILQGR